MLKKIDLDGAVPRRKSPKKSDNPQIGVRLPRAVVDELDEFARAYGIRKNRSDFIREAVDQYLVELRNKPPPQSEK
jgi:metal-responsive CopG/Arc/MetJ family transcriptional regulator